MNCHTNKRPYERPSEPFGCKDGRIAFRPISGWAARLSSSPSRQKSVFWKDPLANKLGADAEEMPNRCSKWEFHRRSPGFRLLKKRWASSSGEFDESIRKPFSLTNILIYSNRIISLPKMFQRESFRASWPKTLGDFLGSRKPLRSSWWADTAVDRCGRAFFKRDALEASVFQKPSVCKLQFIADRWNSNFDSGLFENSKKGNFSKFEFQTWPNLEEPFSLRFLPRNRIPFEFQKFDPQLR